jgi:hypothetical protein
MQQLLQQKRSVVDVRCVMPVLMAHYLDKSHAEYGADS